MESGIMIGMGSVIGNIAVHSRVFDLEALQLAYGLGALVLAVVLAALATGVQMRSSRRLTELRARFARAAAPAGREIPTKCAA